jgi:putative ABC transport system permease protein
MFRHLFILIWNKKRQNALLISEMLLSFLVMFAVFTLAVYAYRNYKKPMGMDYGNVWAVNFNNPLNAENADSLGRFYEGLRGTLRSLPLVRDVAFSSDNLPFYENTSVGHVSYNGKSTGRVNTYMVSDAYAAVLQMQVLEGRWFTREDAVAKNQPVVINRTLKEQLFGTGTAIGQLLGKEDDKNKQKIIGVVEDLKAKGDYAVAGPGIYWRIDTSDLHGLGRMLIRVAPDADAAFEGRLYKTLANAMKHANIEIEHLVNKRTTINYWALVPMIVLLIVAGFLIINVALGLFGVLWYNINRRRGEIGLRRAVGASGHSVAAQLVGESLIIATFSLCIGIFFAVQFPLLHVFDLPAGVYITAILLSVLFIYGLVLICSLYPGRQAAAIYPAVALHED